MHGEHGVLIGACCVHGCRELIPRSKACQPFFWVTNVTCGQCVVAACSFYAEVVLQNAHMFP